MKISDKIKGPKCKVCNSGLRDKIDQMLADGYTLRDIARWANEQKPKLRLRHTAVLNHNKNHRLPSIQEFVTPPTKTDTNSPPPTQKELDDLREKALAIIRNNNPLTVSQFCDLVIAKSTDMMIRGSMKPTVADATKAAELKQRIKSGSPFEQQLVALFLDISKENNLFKFK